MQGQGTSDVIPTKDWSFEKCRLNDEKLRTLIFYLSITTQEPYFRICLFIYYLSVYILNSNHTVHCRSFDVDISNLAQNSSCDNQNLKIVLQMFEPIVFVELSPFF